MRGSFTGYFISLAPCVGALRDLLVYSFCFEGRLRSESGLAGPVSSSCLSFISHFLASLVPVCFLHLSLSSPGVEFLANIGLVCIFCRRLLVIVSG